MHNQQLTAKGSVTKYEWDRRSVLFVFSLYFSFTFYGYVHILSAHSSCCIHFRFWHCIGASHVHILILIKIIHPSKSWCHQTKYNSPDILLPNLLLLHFFWDNPKPSQGQMGYSIPLPCSGSLPQSPPSWTCSD